MTFNSYSEAIDWLFQQFPSYQNVGGMAYKPGLENIYQLLEYFDNPQEKLEFIHVAGTNGKGSTCSMLASILKEGGYTVGLFTSPHIQDFRERIRVNGLMASEDFVVRQTNLIRQAKLTFSPSFFEITFLMSLMYFVEMGCDVCVIETGLGGRLDATNSIVPLVSVITNISLEHTQYLGNTIAAIAGEKAGIIKMEVPVVIGERGAESDPVFIAKAKQEHSEILFACDEPITTPNYFPLLGIYQHYNFQLVLATLRVLRNSFPISDGVVERGLKNLTLNTGFYGRLQKIDENPLVIFDVSHNEAGIKATLDYILSLKKDLKIVYGTSADKDLEAIFSLFPSSANYFMTEFSSERSARRENLELFSQKFHLDAKFYSNPLLALDAAKVSANEQDVILVFGSFFLISDFFQKK